MQKKSNKLTSTIQSILEVKIINYKFYNKVRIYFQNSLQMMISTDNSSNSGKYFETINVPTNHTLALHSPTFSPIETEKYVMH